MRKDTLRCLDRACQYAIVFSGSLRDACQGSRPLEWPDPTNSAQSPGPGRGAGSKLF